MYGLLPVTTVKKISVWLMIIHQFIAWSLYVTPLLFMCVISNPSLLLSEVSATPCPTFRLHSQFAMHVIFI